MVKPPLHSSVDPSRLNGVAPRSHPGVAVWVLLATVVPVAAGAAQTDAADAVLAVRVKTAIVNDADLGGLPIDVRAVAGVVTLEGVVRTAEQADRVVALAAGVPGVARVESGLDIGDPDPLAEQRRPRLPALAPRPTEGPLRLIAAGGTMQLTRASGALRDRLRSIRPVFRFRSSTGLSPAVSFRGGEVALESAGGTQTALAAVRLRPVMAGMNYSLVSGRVTFVAGVVAGYSFNSLSVETARAGPGRAIAVANSFAVQPKLDVWFDVTRRIGLTLGAGYLVSRPKVTFASDASVSTERIRINTAVLSAGLAYWIF